MPCIVLYCTDMKKFGKEKCDLNLEDGYHRIQAAKACGYTHVPALIYGKIYEMPDRKDVIRNGMERYGFKLSNGVCNIINITYNHLDFNMLCVGKKFDDKKSESKILIASCTNRITIITLEIIKSPKSEEFIEFKKETKLNIKDPYNALQTIRNNVEFTVLMTINDSYMQKYNGKLNSKIYEKISRDIERYLVIEHLTYG